MRPFHRETANISSPLLKNIKKTMKFKLCRAAIFFKETFGLTQLNSSHSKTISIKNK